MGRQRQTAMKALALVVMVCAALGDGSALEDALARSVKTKEIVLGEGLEGGKGSVLPTSANRRTLGANPTRTTRIPTARKCHSRCKTCTGPYAAQCTSCSAEDTSLSAWWFKEHEGKRVPEGFCTDPPALKDFNPSLGGVNCSISECRDAATGSQLGQKQPYAATDKTVCSRVCLIGERITNVINLERYDNPDKRTGRRKVDAKFSYHITGGGSFSQPVCSLHKIVMCTKNKDFHHRKCQKFRNEQPGGKAAHCEQENCHVQKNVGCVAILPAKMKDTVHKVLGADLSAYTNECTHAINPCAPAALYM